MGDPVPPSEDRSDSDESHESFRTHRDVYIPVLARRRPTRVVAFVGLEAITALWGSFREASGMARLATVLVTVGLVGPLALVAVVAAHGEGILLTLATWALLLGLIAAAVGGVIAIANRQR